MIDTELNPAQIAGRARRAEERAARRARRLRMHDARKVLVERYPKCFQTFGGPKLPLAVGIGATVLRAVTDIHPHDLINALHDYVTGRSYLSALVAGAARVDLDGHVAGVVTAHNESHAKKMLARMARAAATGVAVVTTAPAKTEPAIEHHVVARPSPPQAKVGAPSAPKAAPPPPPKITAPPITASRAMAARHSSRAQRLLQQTTPRRT